MDDTIKFSTKLDPGWCQYCIPIPFPGTPVYNELKSKDLIDNREW